MRRAWELLRARQAGAAGHRARGGRRSWGLTIFEVAIALAIVATLAALVIPGYKSYRSKVDQAQAILDIRTLEKEIYTYEGLQAKLPDNLGEVGGGNVRDPWGRPYVYLKLAGVKGLGAARKDKATVPLNTDFDLYSIGPDGSSKPPLTAAESQDDVVRALNGAFVGPAEDF
jgi:general secretion pathway protein G